MIKLEYQLNRLLKILQPKKYQIYEYNNEIQKKEMIIDNIDFYNYDWINEKNQNYAFSAFGMYSKIHKCNQLKIEYEKENNFKYDFVWRARLDYIFYEPITIKMINKFKENNVYLIKDRYAHNTKKLLNDKFFGSTSEIMDKITNIYNELPILKNHFDNNKIFFDGQNIIEHKLKTLKNNNEINKINMISHRNVYCKCQCRHQIKLNNINIKIKLNNKNLLFKIEFELLSKGYNIYSDYDDFVLNSFKNYYCNQELSKYKYSISDKEINIIATKKILLNSSNNLDDHIKIYFNKNVKISKIIEYILKDKTKKEYNIINDNFKLFEGQKVKYKVPDRGISIGIIQKIITYKKSDVVKYTINNNNYFYNEIIIFDYSKYI